MYKNRRNYRNREADVLWAVVISLLTSFWIILFPFIVKQFVIHERTDRILDRHPAVIQAHLIYDVMELGSFIPERIPLYFYETRKTVKHVCRILKDLPQALWDDEEHTVVYEQQILE